MRNTEPDQKAATLVDVARAAGVDVSTASRVLRGVESQRVRQETRDRILTAVDKLGYHPNNLARALRTSRSRTLGLILPRLDNPLFLDMFHGVEEIARERGYSVLISRRSSHTTTESLAPLVDANRIEGLLVISYDSDHELANDLAAIRIPIVMMNRRRIAGANHVIFNSHSAAHMMTRYILELGHRRIFHLAGNLSGYNGRSRLQGYRDALKEFDVVYDPSLVEEVGYDAETAVNATHKVLEGTGRQPTAIFAATLLTAAGALRALHERGMSLPNDMSVVTLGDGSLAKLMHPQLTTVAMESHSMGAEASNLLIEKIENGGKMKNIMLEPRGVIERSSAVRLKP